jgi:hypothetical protein
MAATLTGTPTTIAWGTSATPSPQNITIPADATAVYVFASGYRETGNNVPTFTLAGAAPAQQFGLNGDPGQLKAGRVAAWYNPPTGTQSLTITWPTAQDFNANCIVAYTKDGDTTAWRDADGGNTEGSTAISVTLTTVSGDLVLKYDVRSSGGTAPSLSAGWTNAQTQTGVGNDSARLSYISASGTTQVANSEDENYSLMFAVAIPEAAASAAVSIATTAAAQTTAIDADAKPAATVASAAAAQSSAIAATATPSASIATTAAPQVSAVAVAAKPSGTVASSSAAQVSAIGAAAKPTATVGSVAAAQQSAIVGASGNFGTVASGAAPQASDIDGTVAAGVGVASLSSAMTAASAAVVRVVAAVAGVQAPQQSAIRAVDPSSSGSVTKQVPHGGRFGVATAIIQWGRRRLGGDHHAPH